MLAMIFVIFSSANSPLKIYHYPTRGYPTTRTLSSLPDPTRPEVKNHYPSGPGSDRSTLCSHNTALPFSFSSCRPCRSFHDSPSQTCHHQYFHPCCPPSPPGQRKQYSNVGQINFKISSAEEDRF